ncbi:AAA family ATPase [Caulobacter sp. NIBR2454]|uniref:AAA family ATPase n=1 Tax=Caulobacter sp. NIBR2454 TaxID=3015996 RepID=UPI0022B6DF0A|nr:CpaE family protein [Caulobacter sp. NIBR2454]
MSAQPAEADPFDLGFEAEDDFSPPPATPWGDDPDRQILAAAQTPPPPPPPSIEPERAEADDDAADPFADFPPARPDLAGDVAEPVATYDPDLTTPDYEPSAYDAAAHDPDPVDDGSLALEMEAPEEVIEADAPPFEPLEPVEALNPVADLIADVELAMTGAGSDLGVPRISIHAFCALPATGDLIEAAAGDRRMSRASTTVRMGGLAAALEYYQNQPTPSLIMVESIEPAPRLLAMLDTLAEVCDPGTKVIVLGQTNDIALYRELLRRGVSEYLVAPLRPLPLIRAVTGLYADPATPFAGRQIAFVGARGGVGSSTLAHNFAYAIAERLHAGAVLADFDLAFGTAGLDFNQDPLQGVADALSQPDRLDPILLDRMLVKCSERLSLFAAPATLDQDYDISPEAFEEVAQKVRGAAPFVVLDLPHAWSAWKRKMLIASDDLVVVATPDLASLRNAKNIVDLIRQTRPNDLPPRLVLNQVGVPGRPEIPVKDFGEALGIEPSLVLPFEARLFGEAANNGQMVMETAPKSKAAEGIEHLARLISRREAPPTAKPSLFASLFKRG